MLRLEEIQANATLTGLEPNQVVRIVTTERVGDAALTVYYKTADGKLCERMLFRGDECNLSLAEAGRPWAFDAPGEEFKLAVEAYRIDLAHLFDPMMAVHTSNVEPLPHQITAVYESMLPRQPLRYVLADDPGAGKTIMAGLFIRELIMRADARRVLIVAPGSLVEQWQDEMSEKFGLDFRLFSREMVEQTRSGNPFDDADLMVARLDQLSRNEDLQEKLRTSHWDLVVVDEAHKMSASFYGNKLNTTRRFELGKLLGSITRHFLLMTATPHNGKEEDFQLFLSLLDSDRFYGKFRDGAHKVDVSDLMRRMVKEELLKFDGTPLFPERCAKTASYKLSDLEAALYAAVTDYVKEEMNRADRLQDGKRKGTVGFALTTLQRRLASSPEAIYQSLKRRHQRLKRRVDEEKLLQRGGAYLAETMDLAAPEDLDDLTGEEVEDLEETVVDQATAAQTIQELETEILILERLEQQAKEVVHSGQDRKWDQLSSLLQNTPEMHDADGRQRKLIIFSEHKDTLNYLTVKIRGLLGSEEAVINIHGGIRREDRRKAQELFRNDPATRVLVATDAAGEGVNLQNANLMVNYDLPWNPNRLEQRFGRIHRIGQTEVCHLWKPTDAEAAKNGTKLARANFVCLMSGSPISGDYIKAEGKAGRMGSRLMAIVAEGTRGRVYLAPTPEQEAVAQQAKPTWRPDGEIAARMTGGNCTPYGLTSWGDLFTSRQLLALTTFSDLVQEAVEAIRLDALAAGMSDDLGSLDDGGTGAQAYSDAIAVYLAFAGSRMTDRHSSLCRWDPNPSGYAPKIANTFGRQALPMVWDYVEGNPFSPSSGNFLDAVGWVTKVIETSLNTHVSGTSTQADAARQEVTRSKVVSTDPPYYDNIGYADLSDFFYVWLRRSIKPIFPSLFATLAVPKNEELVATPHRHGSKQEAEAFFLVGMTRAIWNLAEQAHPAFPVTIYYAFKQAETKVGDITSSTGWETFLDAVISAGFGICGTWPMRTELGNRMIGSGTNALASSIILVCRKRAVDAPCTSRREFIRELNEALPIALDEMTRGGINSPVAPVDLSQAIIGPGMAIFSKYSAVLEADGSRMPVRAALQLINRFLAEDDFDHDTQFCLHWFENSGWAEGKFGEADVLARAKGTSVEGVKTAGVLESGQGAVRLLRWAEYPKDWDPQTDQRTPVWEALHHLIRALNHQSATDAGALLARMPAKAEPVRQVSIPRQSRGLYVLSRSKRLGESVELLPSALRPLGFAYHTPRSTVLAASSLFGAQDYICL